MHVGCRETCYVQVGLFRTGGFEFKVQWRNGQKFEQHHAVAGWVFVLYSIKNRAVSQSALPAERKVKILVRCKSSGGLVVRAVAVLPQQQRV